MVDLSKLDHSFNQSCNSCVLTSYGIVSNYYTQMPVKHYFRAYCDHFNLNRNRDVDEYCLKNGFIINELNKYECTYDYYFQQEWRKRKCPGLKIIEELHNSSNQPEFAKARRRFNVEFISNVKDDIRVIEKRLLSDDSLLICSSSANPSAAHITIFGHSENRKWFNRNTDPNVEAITYVDSIISFVESKDGLIATKAPSSLEL